MLKRFGWIPAAGVLLVACDFAVAGEKNAYERAFELYCAGRYKEAEVQYRLALRENPKSIGANLELGRLLRERGRAKDALPFAKKAVELAPKMAPAVAELGTVYLALEAWDDAEKYLQKAIVMNPRDAYSLWRLGYVHFKKENLEEAEKTLKRAVAANARLSLAWLDLGRVQQRKGETAEAIASMQTAFETNPSGKEAFEAFAEAVAKGGTPEQKRYVSAWKDHNGGRMGSAERKLRSLLAKNGQDPRVHLLLGHVMLHRAPSKPKKAIAAYTEALALNSKAQYSKQFPVRFKSFLLEGLGIAYMIEGEISKAHEAFTKGARQDRDYPGHFFFLAVLAAHEERENDLFKNLRLMRKRDRGGAWTRQVWKEASFRAYWKSDTFKEILGG
ncbi:MAG: tetratricopeptide repeat protein [Planctomycetota bacterium]|jgi:tetratricopeptide (TPR) repeat protein